MLLVKRVKIKLISIMLLCFVLPFSLSAATPTAQQLQLFNSLSPAEQQQVMGILSKSGASFSSSAAAARSQVQKAKDQAEKTDQTKKIDEVTSIQEEVIPRFEGSDTLIIRYVEKALLLEDDQDTKGLSFKRRIEEKFEPAQPKELYKLDKYGVLDLPYTKPIPLAGLTEEQAAERISLEPIFSHYVITVTKLPLTMLGHEALKPFGYEVFHEDGERETVSNFIPVPKDYIIGPGDNIQIQMFGKENEQYVLEVSREGKLFLPGVGGITVAGLSFSELKRDLITRIKKQYIGVDAQISMGELRSIQVFVTGEVEQPGAYTLGALSTITHSLIAAGGIKEIGSLRNVKLKRNGKVVATLDSYDLLLDGSNKNDQRLMAGDVVHVPSVAKTVSISGEVRRPAIYEVLGGEDINKVIQLAGGILPDAYTPNITLQRVSGGITREVISVDLNASQLPKVKNGDIINVTAVSARLDNVVSVYGLSEGPDHYQWRESLRLSDVVGAIDRLDPSIDLNYALIKRYPSPDFRLNVVDVNIRKALTEPKSSDNIALMPKDTIILFTKDRNRMLHVQQIIDELNKQATSKQPARVVRVQGQVHSEGTFPLTEKMRISDLIRAAARLKDSAYTLEAELTRFEAREGDARRIHHVGVDLKKVLNGDPKADIVLEPYDLLTIKEVPLWEERDHVEVAGEVRFPGKYAIRRGETLSELIKRAGGLTDFAYSKGAVFMREELREREQKQLDAMASNLEAELAAVALQRTGDVSQVSAAGLANDLLSKLRNVKAAGRLVIKLEEIDKALKENREVHSKYDIVLQGGDRLFVPGHMQEVTVLGEVFHPTSHLFSDPMGVDDYIDASGGMTNKADASNVYVIKANGSVKLAKTSWLDPQVAVEAGDTVVVPFDTEKVSSLKLWTDVSQIVYQLGLSVATWNTVGLISF